MNITKLTSRYTQLNFGTKIIDMHTHIGTHKDVTYTKSNLDVFVRQPLPNNDTVERMIVSDTDTFKGVAVNEYEGNKKALQSFNGDKSYAFLASCAPHKGDVKYIQQVMEEFPNDFVGLKFHPNDAKLPLTDTKYIPYFEFANKNKIPCVFHTHVPVAPGGVLHRLEDGTLDRTKLDPYSDPEALYLASKKYKDAPFVMAHMGSGWNESHQRGLEVLVEAARNGDANLYADISWVDIDAKPIVNGRSPKDHIVQAIKKLKGIGDPTWDKGDQSFRLMFGTDAPIDRFYKSTAREAYTKFVEEIKAAIRGDKDLAKDAEKIIEDLFYNNAKNLFFREKVTQTVTNATKQSGGRAKVIGGIAAAIAVVGGGAAALRHRNNQSSNQK